VCFVFSTKLSKTILIPRRIERDMVKIYIGLHVNTRYYCKISLITEFSRNIFEKKNIPISNFI
jgi:hypothetical protein